MHAIRGCRPLFILGIPFNCAAHDPGNGQMVAFMAKDRAAVDRAYDLTLADGGKDEGRPGLRPLYHTNYYGAYFRDTEGNKVCVVCNEAIAGQGELGCGLCLRATTPTSKLSNFEQQDKCAGLSWMFWPGQAPRLSAPRY